ncbi:hypothetical protein HanHA300_Chr16g0616731 [Helianthus annuus]|nr:hypothetical protein HanHA300_Chr16g0616731 [Helianthus annuus]KAJ0461021.1 hypothetical protein HanHA89_Chr16g0667591 [Helianthus annuus]KAJ0641447.1 hypothetical protein HanLR1_Chr16g0627311 [Helianthus annuus]KAJ0645341.1 hypothetical protein HanOQP8_Chr16g0622811 [Helianthus annuus]
MKVPLVGNTNRSVEAVDINLLILFENFIHCFAAVIVAPSIITIEIT